MMKPLRTRLLIVTLVLLWVSAPNTTLASPVTQAKALQNAQAFLQEKGRRVAVSSLRHAPMPAVQAMSQQPYYVFNIGDNQGYVIASGDDCTYPVLGYADSGAIDVNDIPCNMQAWLDDYADQIKTLQKRGVSASSPPKRTTDYPTIAPMLTCHWNQGYPYNKFCPVINGQRCVTGCVATALAQVLYYHRAHSTRQITYDIPSYTTDRYGLMVDAIPAGTPIDWDNMIDDYNYAPSTSQMNAVANLMQMCGSAVQMDYAVDGSSSYLFKTGLVATLYFNYSNKAKYTERAIDYYTYTDEEWEALVYNELKDSRPVLYCGISSAGGHAFVCDGYDGNGFFHINWGWGGNQDGSFLLTIADVGEVISFNNRQAAVFGAEPSETLTQLGTGLHFDDPYVRFICLQNWDTNDDTSLSVEEAEAVQYIFTFFSLMNDYENIDYQRYGLYWTLCSFITSFDEFKYFTGVIAIDYAAFCSCYYLKSIKLPDSLLYIGPLAFESCRSLTSITIPNAVETICSDAFANCPAMTSVTLGKSVNFIEGHVFSENVKNIVCLAPIPPFCYGNAFADYVTSVLRVPVTAVDAYKSTAPWSQFSNIVGLDPSLGDVNMDTEVNIADINCVINSVLSPGDDILNDFMSDVNCDGEVNIADLNTLIDIILSDQN